MVAHHLGEDYEPIFYLGGAGGKLRRLANEHSTEFEKELDNKNPQPLFGDFFVTEDEFKK